MGDPLKNDRTGRGEGSFPYGRAGERTQGGMSADGDGACAAVGRSPRGVVVPECFVKEIALRAFTPPLPLP